MKYKITLVFLLFFNLFFAQTAIKQDSVFAKKIKIFNTNYKEFEVIENIVYAVTNSNYLIVFDFSNSLINQSRKANLFATEHSSSLREYQYIFCGDIIQFVFDFKAFS